MYVFYKILSLQKIHICHWTPISELKGDVTKKFSKFKLNKGLNLNVLKHVFHIIFFYCRRRKYSSILHNVFNFFVFINTSFCTAKNR